MGISCRVRVSMIARMQVGLLLCFIAVSQSAPATNSTPEAISYEATNDRRGTFQDIQDELASEIKVLQQVKQKLKGLGEKDIADMMDTNKDGKVTNTEMKNWLFSLTGTTELDEIVNAELDLLFDHLKDADGTIDVSGYQVTDRVLGTVINAVVSVVKAAGSVLVNSVKEIVKVGAPILSAIGNLGKKKNKQLETMIEDYYYQGHDYQLYSKQ